MQQQLDNDEKTGVIAEQATSIVQKSLEQMKTMTASMTDMGVLIASAQGFGKMTKEQQEDFNKALAQGGAQAMNWLQDNASVSANETGDLGGSGGGGGSNSSLLQDQALQGIDNIIASYNNKTGTSVTSIKGNREYGALLKQYTDNGGTTKEFEKYIQEGIDESITGGYISGVSVSGINENGGYSGTYDEITATMNDHKYVFQVAHTKNGGSAGSTNIASSTAASELSKMVGSPKNGSIAMYNRHPYIYIAGNRKKWYQIDSYDGGDDNGGSFATNYLNKLRGYKTGGLADFTGPAWLDGTKSKPEMVLNQKDTANFIVLKDVLSEILDGTGNLSQKEGQNGDNYFNIDINVEKLEDDYDIEQLADKIRRMIYDDAMYRNVNTINLIR